MNNLYIMSNYKKLNNCPQTFSITYHNEAIDDAQLYVYEYTANNSTEYGSGISWDLIQQFMHKTVFGFLEKHASGVWTYEWQDIQYNSTIFVEESKLSVLM